VAAWVCDVDGDGYAAQRCASGDCDDYDPNVNPRSIELLDGVDNDCDGAIDDGTAAWDSDGDCQCVTPQCTGSANAQCATVVTGDCDDDDVANYSGNTEVCDGGDNDCDQLADEGLQQLTWWTDGDGDGFGSQVAAPVQSCSTVPPLGAVANNADCDDLHANVGPLAAEVECDGLDNDCEPSTRDGVDEDGDDVDRCFDCDDADATQSPANEELCDARDNDCDGEADDGLDFDDYWPDADGDGFGNEDEDEIEWCDDVPGWADNDDDCNDNNWWINPDAYEWHCDGIDNDCDDGDECP
jgi:hypothetical protein